jgi:hypothetical protein
MAAVSLVRHGAAWSDASDAHPAGVVVVHQDHRVPLGCRAHASWADLDESGRGKSVGPEWEKTDVPEHQDVELPGRQGQGVAGFVVAAVLPGPAVEEQSDEQLAVRPTLGVLLAVEARWGRLVSNSEPMAGAAGAQLAVVEWARPEPPKEQQ